MSEARNQRFEIDIDEIERQLRRSVESTPSVRPDPLAELARIVGQDDPFRGILGKGRADPSNVHAFSNPGATPVPQVGRYEGGQGAYGADPHPDELFDPVTDTYGSLDAALDSEDIQPLRPRRSRGRLAGVAALLVLTVACLGAALYWRKAGSTFLASANPPVIVADRTPLKVAPDNPGGVEVPNQNRQIYERSAPDGQSRVVDAREQPIDVREAARTMPSTGISARTPIPSSDSPDPPRSSDVVAVSTPGLGRSAVANALGEPTRVRTVSVRPDGTTYAPTANASSADPLPAMIPASLPPPVPVATIPVSSRPGAQNASLGTMTSPTAADPAPTGTPVSVLPPARPKLRATAEPATDEAPTRAAVASADKPLPAANTRAAAERPASDKPASEKPVAAARKFSVQIAVRPTDQEARAAYGQLQEKFVAELDGRDAQVSRAEIKGKEVHRVRVGPMSKEDADGLCGRLKSSGGSCFVAAN